MITKFKLFERSDIEQSEKFEKISRYILRVIKRHFNKCIKNFLDDDDKEQLNNNLQSLKYKDTTIQLVKNMNISYAKDTTGNKYLNIGLESILVLIKEIETAAKQGKLTKDYIKNVNIYNLLDKWEKSAIIHELTHKSDDETFDLFGDLLLKIYGKKEPTKEEIEKDSFEKYMKIYNDIPTEYNAYFIQMTNVIINKIKINPKILNSFGVFKKYFLIYFKHYSNDLYDKGRFQKHIDKRLYLLYQNLTDKEKVNIS